MPIGAGAKLGPYEITAAIGAGGMGEVYRARDKRLDREVAIKVLPSELVQDRERLTRFEREAKLLASLKHSNIAHVYGLESAALDDGQSVRFLAMELVDGEDLADRLVSARPSRRRWLEHWDSPSPVAEPLWATHFSFSVCGAGS
jgi:serine/threonine protein kinase